MPYRGKVTDYIAAYRALLVEVPSIVEEDKIRFFMTGLPYTYKIKLASDRRTNMPFTALSDVCTAAVALRSLTLEEAGRAR